MDRNSCMESKVQSIELSVVLSLEELFLPLVAYCAARRR
jgi:hypothetical protein